MYVCHYVAIRRPCVCHTRMLTMVPNCRSIRLHRAVTLVKAHQTTMATNAQHQSRWDRDCLRLSSGVSAARRWRTLNSTGSGEGKQNTQADRDPGWDSNNGHIENWKTSNSRKNDKAWEDFTCRETSKAREARLEIRWSFYIVKRLQRLGQID